MVASIIISIIFLSLVLIKSADLVIVAVRRLSRETSKKSFIISALILAVGTSFPELSVAITSSLEKASKLSSPEATVEIGANAFTFSGYFCAYKAVEIPPRLCPAK